MQRLAIFGGTFDPIHRGHLLVAEIALAQLHLEQVIWVPSKNPPHKQAALFEHRVAMLQLATANNPAFTVSLIERERSGTSYAINTLIDLSTCYPNTNWYWIIGLDAFQTLPRWYLGHELAQMCDWLIAPRLLGGETIAQSESICKQVEQELKEQAEKSVLTRHLGRAERSPQAHIIHWQLLHTPLVRVSSSIIREFCRVSHSIHGLVPESVSYYITNHNLYSNNSE
ncbi:nicotinate (nicotinamide) nucleotide adenylyltransferase [Anabaena cylindrica FACHB-243]|uniref:Probable nicotinate-nucleotide adenylyltransferase n=1 Tax=Anabaena cylindrica (strain ATCC 27899 / PCC 7122) TaxID=272123 RepID=K9ZAV5_ANACC|nr:MULTISPECIES: nicotinate (nicotinamide) nucleotide adenylyltransferase [Anabaena]AFZ55869.1 nicotinate-nucleotide adenylyltransferase [Anabaena cylindrica PCC 7122]MBD2421289.1 nicotinate (nicotinamide) nucleotide adenylyltransferase [Anabaena cylindrica FACHB-243]MBY5285210.1 nicotinate (nicotinamide) nucleotide adenylyltransferase [Anabaena sp. CCAP 1446/1C]MBY5309831.1 nicotinate (nicotinamide) nucleotide adenylyltransferase [Anabaena sp. CCAP 1446/1C]MCM2406621.1 nicotinate (nicotinamid